MPLVLRVISVILLTVGFSVVPWNAAEAVAANCTAAANHPSRSGSYTIRVPVMSGGSENCLRGPSGSVLESTEALQLPMSLCYGVDLGSSGPNHDGIDGVYGAKTIAGMRQIQDVEGVTIDGVYGPRTHNEMGFYRVSASSFGCATARRV
jgi:hypothetical protein